MASPRLTRKPKIDSLALSGLDDLDAEVMAAYETVEFGRFDDVELVSRDLSGITLTDCELTGVTVEERTAMREVLLRQTRAREP